MLVTRISITSLRRVRLLIVTVVCGLLLPVSSRAAPLMYVTDLSDTVTIIDTSTNNVTARIVPTFAAGYVGVAVSPDGSKVYLANGNHTITVIKSTTHNPTFDTIHLDPSLTPISVAVTPDGSNVYVANAGSNTVSAIDTSTNAVTGMDIMCNQNGTNNCSTTPPISVTPSTHAGMADVNVYVGTLNGFAVIDTATKSFVKTVLNTCGPNPCPAQAISASGDGATVFVSQFETNTVLGIDVPMMNLINDIAMVGANPVGLVVTPDRGSVYVANMNGNSVSVINVGSCGPVCTVSEISTGIVAEPDIVAVTPDGSKVYVGGNATELSVIDTSTHTVVGTVQNLTSAPFGMAIGPSDDKGGIPNSNGTGSSGCSISPTAGASTAGLPSCLIPLIGLRRMRRRAAQGRSSQASAAYRP